MDGATTWKASSARPPWATGSVRGPMIFVNSAMEPGQPWVMTSGSASGCGDRWWMKWMSRSPMTVLYWSKALSRRSCSRQSNSSRQ